MCPAVVFALVLTLVPRIHGVVDGRAAAIAKIKPLGAFVLSGILRAGTSVVLVSLNNKQITDKTLALLKALPDSTDLSLADSSITSKGLAHLKNLKHLKRLHLAAPGVDYAGLEALKGHQ